MSMSETFEKHKISVIPRVAEVVDELFERGEWEDFIPKLELYDLVLKELYNTGYHSGEHKPECSAISMYVTAKFSSTLTRTQYKREDRPRGWRFVKLRSKTLSKSLASDGEGLLQ